MPATNNTTGRTSLDVIAAHPAVASVFTEDGNGYWVDLKEGWWNEELEATVYHEYTCRDLLEAWNSCPPSRTPDDVLSDPDFQFGLAVKSCFM